MIGHRVDEWMNVIPIENGAFHVFVNCTSPSSSTLSPPPLSTRSFTKKSGTFVPSGGVALKEDEEEAETHEAAKKSNTKETVVLPCATSLDATLRVHLMACAARSLEPCVWSSNVSVRSLVPRGADPALHLMLLEDTLRWPQHGNGHAGGRESQWTVSFTPNEEEQEEEESVGGNGNSTEGSDATAQVFVVINAKTGLRLCVASFCFKRLTESVPFPVAEVSRAFEPHMRSTVNDQREVMRLQHEVTLLRRRMEKFIHNTAGGSHDAVLVGFTYMLNAKQKRIVELTRELEELRLADRDRETAYDTDCEHVPCDITSSPAQLRRRNSSDFIKSPNGTCTPFKNQSPLSVLSVFSTTRKGMGAEQAAVLGTKRPAGAEAGDGGKVGRRRTGNYLCEQKYEVAGEDQCLFSRYV